MTAQTVRHAQPAYATTLPSAGYEHVPSPAACEFLVDLHETFAPRVQGLLRARRQRRARLEAGEVA